MEHSEQPPRREGPQVTDETDLRIRPDEKTPEPGNRHAVPVPEKEWEAHNRRKDTATGQATGQGPVE